MELPENLNSGKFLLCDHGTHIQTEASSTIQIKYLVRVIGKVFPYSFSPTFHDMDIQMLPSSKFLLFKKSY